MPQGAKYLNPALNISDIPVIVVLPIVPISIRKPVQQPLVFKWEKKNSVPSTYKKFKYNQPYSPNVSVDLDSPLAIFETFFDTKLFERIQIQTKLYVSQNNKTFTTSA